MAVQRFWLRPQPLGAIRSCCRLQLLTACVHLFICHLSGAYFIQSHLDVVADFLLFRDSQVKLLLSATNWKT